MKLELSMLISDWLIFILFFLVIFGVYSIRNQAQITSTWKKVFTRPLSMIACVVLVFYIIVALLDSVHFKVTESDSNGSHAKSIQQKSLLDFMISPLGFEDEKTYSSPFGSFSFVKSLVTQEDGTEKRAYAPLKHAAVGLTKGTSKTGDIIFRLLKGCLWGIFISLLLIQFILFLLSKGKVKSFFRKNKMIWNQESSVKWFHACVTFICVLVVVSCIYQVSRNYHVFGTSQIGQDVLYEAIKSIRTGLLIGTLTTLFMLPFSLFLGTVAGYFGGKVDDLISYLYTTVSSVPSVLLISASVLVLQVYLSSHSHLFSTLEQRSDARLLMLCLVLGLTSWAHLCRLLRGETLKLRELNYIRAAKSLGVRSFPIIWNHIIPNIMHIVLITIVLDFSGLILAEAVLSYVGVGVDPTTMSWGNMINSSRLELARQPAVWWPLLAALVFMFVLILSANIFSDAVRDAFDPKLKDEVK